MSRVWFDHQTLMFKPSQIPCQSPIPESMPTCQRFVQSLMFQLRSSHNIREVKTFMQCHVFGGQFLQISGQVSQLLKSFTIVTWSENSFNLIRSCRDFRCHIAVLSCENNSPYSTISKSVISLLLYSKIRLLTI